MRKKMLGVLVAIVASVVMQTATAWPAEASVHTSADVPGAWGQLKNVSWESADLVNFRFWLQDTDADGDHAQARVQAVDANGHATWFSWHYAIGDGVINEGNTHVRDINGVQQIRIQVCRVGDDLPDICAVSPWLYNPYR